MFANKCL